MGTNKNRAKNRKNKQLKNYTFQKIFLPSVIPNILKNIIYWTGSIEKQAKIITKILFILWEFAYLKICAMRRMVALADHFYWKFSVNVPIKQTADISMLMQRQSSHIWKIVDENITGNTNLNLIKQNGNIFTGKIYLYFLHAHRR